MTQKLSAAVIGCGAIGAGGSVYPGREGAASHCAAFAGGVDTQLLAVCDMNVDLAKAAARRFGVPGCFADTDALLEQGPELVSICSSTGSHLPVFERVITCAGVKGILLEKPLAGNLEDARRIVALAGSARIPVVVNYSRRFSPRLRSLAQWLKQGGVGQVQHVSGLYTKNVVHNGSHWLDLARMLVGEITSLQGSNNASSVLQQEGTVNVQMEFACGAQGVLVGCNERCFTVFEMDIVGSAGRVRLVDLGRSYEIYSVTESLRHPGYRELILNEAVRDRVTDDVVLQAVTNLVACVRGLQEPYCSLSDGLRALELGEAALRDCMPLKSHSVS